MQRYRDGFRSTRWLLRLALHGKIDGAAAEARYAALTQHIYEAPLRAHDMVSNHATKAPGADFCKLLMMRWRAHWLRYANESR